MDATISDSLSQTAKATPRRLGLPSLLIGPRLLLVSFDHPQFSSPAVIAQWAGPWFSMLTDPEVMKSLTQGGVQFMTEPSEFPKYLQDRTTAIVDGKAANYAALKPKDPSILSACPLAIGNGTLPLTPEHFALVGIGGIPREIEADDGSLVSSHHGVVRRAEIGIILDKIAQGHGYTHEIMHLVLDALYKDAVGFQEAWWRTLDGNVGMRAWCSSVMPQVKATEWATKPASLKGTWVEYVLSKDEYKKPGGVREAIQGKLEKVIARSK